MKFKFTSVVILLLLIFPFCSRSQISVDNIVNRIDAANYIFEGEVIRADGYWSQDKDWIYTSVTVDIKKMFKGDLQCGKVELITDGGKVADTVELKIVHNLNLGKGQKGLFLCKLTDKQLPVIDFYPENNNQKLETVMDEQGLIVYFDDGVNPEAWDYQFRLDSLAQVYGLMDMYTSQINYVDCYPGKSIFENSSTSNGRLSQSVNTLSNDTNLYYTLQNPQITTSGSQNYFEYDLDLHSNRDSIYLLELTTGIRYDTMSFFAGSGTNSHIIVTLNGAKLDTNYYKITTLNFYRDYFTLALELKFPSGNSYYQLTNTPTPALHIKMEVNNCSRLSILNQFYITQYGRYNVTNSLTSDFLYFDDCARVNNLNFNGCTPQLSVINSISPTQIKGGTGDVVTISGHGFGNSRGAGGVFFKNADNGGQTYVQLDSADYVSWNNDTIVIVMPSVVDSAYGYHYKYKTPGSGQIKIKTDSGNVITAINDTVNIYYAVTNTSDVNYNKFFVNLVSDVSAPGSFVFRPDTTITNYPDRLAAVRKALADWTCATTINWILGTELNTTPDTAKMDGVSVIKLGKTIPVARTSQHNNIAVGCNSTWTSEIDLILNKDKIFWADTNETHDCPNGSFDMYAILLHELGHAHSLDHINDPSKIMWYATDDNGDSAVNRKIRLYADAPAIEAGQYAMNRSYNFNFAACQNGTRILTTGSANCTHVIGIADVDNIIYDLTVFPNPASDEMRFRFTIEKPTKARISIHDVQGREVFTSTEVIQSGTSTKEIPLHTLENGIYILRISTGSTSYIAKFVKG